MSLLSDSSSRSLIISASELAAREGMVLEKSLNFRDGRVEVRLSVIVILPRAEGYTDVWDVGRELYIVEGHDSLAEGTEGRGDDQLLMYASGKPTENGKFFKAANAYKDGLRGEPLQVQVYEKLDAGVYFDKGIFNLVDATFGKGNSNSQRDARKVARFYLKPVDAVLPIGERIVWNERMLPASVKADAWRTSGGKCAICGEQSEIHVDTSGGEMRLHCSAHILGN